GIVSRCLRPEPQIELIMSNVYKPQKSPRNPKCARCRNHGFIVQLKGHSGQCQFLKCNCWKCSLIAERTKIMAFQRRIKKTNKEESALNLTWSRPSDTPVDGTLSGRVENAHQAFQGRKWSNGFPSLSSTWPDALPS
uniref:DM domain-containing protein n=1 Tax=Oncorhynchus tshawytscha TaxID=74940 RepID=A0A8C8IAB4_ONCTS